MSLSNTLARPLAAVGALGAAHLAVLLVVGRAILQHGDLHKSHVRAGFALAAVLHGAGGQVASLHRSWLASENGTI